MTSPPSADTLAAPSSSLPSRADELWESLSPFNRTLPSDLGVANALIAVQPGALPFVLFLGPDGRVGYASASAMPDGIDWLPRVAYRPAGFQ